MSLSMPGSAGLACVLGMLLALLTAGPAQGADPLDELRERLDLLEADNRQLRATLDSEKEAPGEIPVVPPAPAGIAGQVALQDEDIRQDHNITELQGTVKGIMDRMNAKTFPTVQVHGVFQADTGWFDQSPASVESYGHIQNGSDFRRARLSANGNLTDITKYFFQMDFAFFGRPTFTDVWVEQNEVPLLGNVRIGQWKQPFSLEVVSSFRYTTFVERSSLFQAFTPFRHYATGFQNHSEDLQFQWAASVMATGQDQYGGSLANAGGWGTAERFTWVPIWDEASNGREYLHLGVGHFFNAPPNKTTVFRTIPELYIGQNAAGAVGSSGQAQPGAFNGTPFFVNTGNMGVSSYNVLGTELLWVEGPFSLQSEAMVNYVNQIDNRANTVNYQNPDGNSTAMFYGAYVSVGYFLTGEHRPYDRATGQIDRIKPFHNFSPWKDDCGWGAWELAGRWSLINLNDANIRGGQMTDYTAAVNWYVNPNWKICFNYIHSMPNFSYQGGNPATGLPATAFYGSTTNMFDIRVQMDF